LRRGAGTTSRVGFVVSGSNGDTGVRELKDEVRKVWFFNSYDMIF